MSGPEFKEPVFKEIENHVSSGNIIPEDLLQRWIDVSQKYRDRDEVVFGMHGGDCSRPLEGECCGMSDCENGHSIVTGVQERESGNIVNMVGCTSPDCYGPQL